MYIFNILLLNYNYNLMTLVLISYSNNDKNNPWNNKGINEDDIEMAYEVGLLTPKYDKSLINNVLINKYLDELEDIENEFINFIDDEKLLYGYIDDKELIYEGKIYKYIDVRIVRKNNEFSIGSIDGISNVYIPKNISKNCSIGELIKMDIIYKPVKNNIWKAIHYYEKYKPNIISNYICINNDICYSNIINLSLPIQNIGKMIGKNGICIQKILNNIAYNNKDFKLKYCKDNKNVLMNQDSLPKYNVINKNNKTYVTIWDKPYKRNYNLNPIIDILCKLYT